MGTSQIRPSDVRRRVLADHAELRERLVRLEQLARKVNQGEHPLVGPLRDGGRALLERLCEHMAWEDRHLAPALLGADAWGPEREARLARDHAEQRELLAFALERLSDPTRPPVQVARDVLDLIAVLRDDMEDEEGELLDERVLRDDVVGIDVEAG